ncbi:hypothetical protein PHMEG_00013093 [Phytophthora megakarya]|uniref:DUF6570 domain-containing protein n=1 Tax=Phytophthora megakarya TaxID=4795 RepID=A0A225W7K6_9STRA|nr:hypothetical protein PHMEG_00013093 [Phytophthora megakarya]
MSTGQSYTSDLRLALAYYYCCGGHPEAFLFNDEHVRDSECVRERITSALGTPPGVAEYSRCQASAVSAEPSLTLRTSPEDKVRKYVQILVGPDGRRYNLNPDLARDTERIYLCLKCAHNSRKSKFSLASGHDYGIYTELPKLNAVGSNFVAPARCFGLEFSLSRKNCSGHAICFPLRCPQSCAKIPPATDVDRKPRVTFIGPSEEWRAQKYCYRRLENIESDNSHTQVEKRVKLQESIESDVIVSNDDALHADDDALNS